jgi:HD-like signal output (HDOD) protein
VSQFQRTKPIRKHKEFCMDKSAQAAIALKNLPAFPPVAAKVMTLLQNEDVSIEDIAETLNTDAALSAAVLHLSNSALLSPRFEVRNIPQAISVLGMTRLSGLILTVSMSIFVKHAGFEPMLRRCWRHNLACALAAREFARSFGSDQDDGYNAGLFHEVGRLAFLALEPGLYSVPVSAEDDLERLELGRFGVDHCEAGAWLLEQWKLPQIFADVARRYCAPMPQDGELTMLVNAACAVANRLGFYLVELKCEESELDLSDELGAMITQTINAMASEYGI